MGAKEKIAVLSLQNGNSVVEGTKNLLIHATDYYKELFGPAPRNLFNLSPDLWSPG